MDSESAVFVCQWWVSISASGGLSCFQSRGVLALDVDAASPLACLTGCSEDVGAVAGGMQDGVALSTRKVSTAYGSCWPWRSLRFREAVGSAWIGMLLLLLLLLLGAGGVRKSEWRRRGWP